MNNYQPLTLGNQTYANNLIQGPLAGVSCAPFRRLIWRYSQPAFCYTEMISCKTLLHKPNQAQRRFIEKAVDEGPVCFQLSSSDPLELAEAVKRVTDFGADLIDLNCGCPVKKIRKRGAGSKLLASPTTLYRLIKALKDNTHVPVSIKIRVDGSSSDNMNAIVAQVVQDAGADFLVVHGRHWTDNYQQPCYYDQIRFFVESLSIPVIGNGDIHCTESLNSMLATGCAGAMISRAGVGQPWLIKQLLAEANQMKFARPVITTIGEIFIEHIQTLIELLGKERFAIDQARKLGKYYARPLRLRTAFCQALNHCTDFASLQKICAQFFV